MAFSIKHGSILILACSSFCLLMLSACTSEPYFSKEIQFEGNIWTDGSIVRFEFPVEDTSGIFDMNLDLEIDKEKYPYQNLYVKIITTFPSGESHEQILSLNLFSRIGYAEGNCRGEICEVSITIQQNIFFPEKGLYKLELLPWMRMETIPGIHSIRLEIFESEA